MITATVTVEDYISAHRLHARSAKRNWFLTCAITAAIGAALLIAGTKFWGVMLLGAGLGGLLGTWWDVRIRIPGKVRKLYSQFKGIAEPAQISWDSEYIEGRSPDGQGRRKWRDYVRLMENEEVFLLYITDQMWQVIPKHCFANAAEIDEFRKHASLAGT